MVFSCLLWICLPYFLDFICQLKESGGNKGLFWSPLKSPLSTLSCPHPVMWNSSLNCWLISVLTLQCIFSHFHHLNNQLVLAFSCCAFQTAEYPFIFLEWSCLHPNLFLFCSYAMFLWAYVLVQHPKYCGDSNNQNI